MRDSKIIELLFRRDSEGIVLLDKYFGSRLKSSARRYLDDERDVEEVYNDTLADVWRSIPPDRPEKLGAYCMAVLKRRTVDKLRYLSSKKRSRDKEDIFADFDELSKYAMSELSAEEEVLADGSDLINEFLREEPTLSRIIFLKRYCYGYGIKEIADDSGITESAVYSRLSRTRAKLYEYLKRKGYLL